MTAPTQDPTVAAHVRVAVGRSTVEPPTTLGGQRRAPSGSAPGTYVRQP